MPFKSQKQRSYFYSQLPKLAKKWEKDTLAGKLPEYVHKHAEGGEIKPLSLHDYLKKKRDEMI